MRAPAMAAIAMLALAGCETGPAAPPPPSAKSAELRHYYQQVQDDLLARGLMRTDGGGPDTAFTADDLARDFLAIAFNDEFPGRNGSRARRLGRWEVPVRLAVEFGPSVPPATRAGDRRTIAGYARRLARITGHAVAPATSNANFFVIEAGEDDSAWLAQRLPQLIPGLTPQETALFIGVPRGTFCQVIAFSDPADPFRYARAIALIRAEHPDLSRRACIHEELAQGLGLPNDSPAARPSIFNDDDEFALLTNHDELLLKLLYDPRLVPGMTAAQAAPLVRQLAREYMGLAS